MNFQWPKAARRAMAVFYTKWNDIDIFIEDTAEHAESIYTALMNQILAGNARVEKIFPLGPRTNVIEACRCDSAITVRPRIYLIDGDLDLLVGKREPFLPRLFQHHVYAIENYLLSEDALVEILHEENPRQSRESVKEKLDFSSWQHGLTDLYRVFIMFGISKLLAPELPTISLGIGAFITDCKLDTTKIDTFLKDRKNSVLLIVSNNKFTAVETLVKRRLKSEIYPLDLLAARDFVFPLLRFWIKSVGLALKANNEALQFRLAKIVPLDRHIEFVKAIQSSSLDS